MPILTSGRREPFRHQNWGSTPGQSVKTRKRSKGQRKGQKRSGHPHRLEIPTRSQAIFRTCLEINGCSDFSRCGCPDFYLTFILTFLSSGIALILGVDRILDMVRTATNVTGDCAVTVLVDAVEKKLEAKEAAAK